MAVVFITTFPAGPFAANCYLIAPNPGGEAVIIDPGMQAADTIKQAVAQHELRVRGVIVTHGHIDHMCDVRAVCGAYDAPVWVPEADRHYLADPLGQMGEMGQMLAAQFGLGEFAEPETVISVTDGDTLDVAGLSLTAHHAPGHTPGSTLFRLSGDDGDIVFSGDVLFRGSIGRMDLPGGSEPDMAATLRNVVLRMTDDVVVLPGHGDQTTIGAERAANPYLTESQLAQLENAQ